MEQHSDVYEAGRQLWAGSDAQTFPRRTLAGTDPTYGDGTEREESWWMPVYPGALNAVDVISRRLRKTAVASTFRDATTISLGEIRGSRGLRWGNLSLGLQGYHWTGKDPDLELRISPHLNRPESSTNQSILREHILNQAWFASANRSWTNKIIFSLFHFFLYRGQLQPTRSKVLAIKALGATPRNNHTD